MTPKGGPATGHGLYLYPINYQTNAGFFWLQSPSPYLWAGPYYYLGNLYVIARQPIGPAYKAQFWKSTDHGYTWTALPVDTSSLTWSAQGYTWDWNPSIFPDTVTFYVFNSGFVDFSISTETWGAPYATTGGPTLILPGPVGTPPDFAFTYSSVYQITRMKSGQVRLFYETGPPDPDLTNPLPKYTMDWANATHNGNWISVDNIVPQVLTPGLEGPGTYAAISDVNDTSHILYIKNRHVDYPGTPDYGDVCYMSMSASGVFSPEHTFYVAFNWAEELQQQIFVGSDNRLYITQVNVFGGVNPAVVSVWIGSALLSPSWTNEVITTYDTSLSDYFKPNQARTQIFGGEATVMWDGKYPNRSGANGSCVQFSQRGAGGWSAPTLYANMDPIYASSNYPYEVQPRFTGSNWGIQGVTWSPCSVTLNGMAVAVPLESDNVFGSGTVPNGLIIYLIGPTTSAGPTPPEVFCPASTTGQVGTAYSDTFMVLGGTGPYVFSIPVGSLPPGLSFNTSTGAISGTPTLAGTYNFTIRVTDSVGLIGTNTCSITIGAPPPPNFLPPVPCS